MRPVNVDRPAKWRIFKCHCGPGCLIPYIAGAATQGLISGWWHRR